MTKASVEMSRLTPEQIEQLPRFLMLGVFVDDGAIFWVNGFEVTRYNAAEGFHAFDAKAFAAVSSSVAAMTPPRFESVLPVGADSSAVHAYAVSLTFVA